MNKEILKIHLHMFDGTGADGGAAADGGQGAEGAEPTVVYGKAESSEASGEGEGSGESQSEDPEGTSPEDAFKALIEGEYREQFANKVDDIMQRRFRNAQDYQAKINQYEQATQLLMVKYGLEPGDIQGLQNAIENDDGLYSAGAEQAGMTPEAYREKLRLQVDAQMGKYLQQELARQQERQRAYARWGAEGEALKEAFPNFDLESEMNNEDFRQSLERGNDVRTSFFIAHMDDILNGQAQHVSHTAQQATVDNIMRRAARPAENSAAPKPAVVRKDDPSKMTDDDLFAIADRARRGEKISF